MAENKDYVLGRGVTKQVRGQENRTSSVVSIRLSAEELDVLGAIAERHGKNFSQVIRDAIRLMASSNRTELGLGGVISFENGGSVAVGDRRAISRSVTLGERYLDAELSHSRDENYALAVRDPH